MAQYIDKASVVAEIRERIDRNNETAASYSSNSEHDYLCRIKESVYKDLLLFLDTLEVKEIQEEPVNEELEDITQKITYEGEVYTRCYKDKLDEFACKYPISVPKPPKRYAKYSDTDLTIAVKEGAKWQREQMQYRENLEVKKVDLEKELKILDNTLFNLDGVAVQGATHYLIVEDVKDIAKRFFELGLKVKQESNDEVKIGETQIYLEDDGGEPPYEGKQWLDLSCMEYEIPKTLFKDGDNVEIFIRKAQKGE